MMQRLEDVLAKIETAVAVRDLEHARLRRVEAAAVAALADLDSLLDDAEAPGLVRQGRSR